VQSALVVDSQFTASPNDMDVFSIVRIDPPNEAMLKTCAAEGHG